MTFEERPAFVSMHEKYSRALAVGVCRSHTFTQSSSDERETSEKCAAMLTQMSIIHISREVQYLQNWPVKEKHDNTVPDIQILEQCKTIPKNGCTTARRITEKCT